MLERIKQSAKDYLHENMDSQSFIEECKNFYTRVLSEQQLMYELDYIIILPFIHEFGYCRYTNVELRKSVKEFLSIMEGDMSYDYSTFMKIVLQDKESKDTQCLLRILKERDWIKLSQKFVERIKRPQNIREVLNNLIIDILEALDFSDLNESCFNCVHCSQNMVELEIEEKLSRLLSYYLGERVFLIHISVLDKNNRVFVVV